MTELDRLTRIQSQARSDYNEAFDNARRAERNYDFGDIAGETLDTALQTEDEAHAALDAAEEEWNREHLASVGRKAQARQERPITLDEEEDINNAIHDARNVLTQWE